MNSKTESRSRLPARLLTVLLWPALIAGFASVGHAQEPSSLVITVKRPAPRDFNASIRKEVHERTQVAVWMTRIHVRTDLGVKLGQPTHIYRLAASDMNKRG